MNVRDLFVAFVVLCAGLMVACTGEQFVSDQLAEVIEQATPTAKPIVSIDTFSSRMRNACQDTIDWWNSDPSKEGDIPMTGVQACVDALVENWCDELKVNCVWPGPSSEHPISDGHEAAGDALVALSTDNVLLVSLGGRFVEQFKIELENQRTDLGIIDP